MHITELVLNITDKSKYIVMHVIVTMGTYTVNIFKELPSKEIAFVLSCHSQLCKEPTKDKDFEVL